MPFIGESDPSARGILVGRDGVKLEKMNIFSGI